MNCIETWIVALLVGFASGPLYIIALCAGFTVVGVVGGSFAAITQSGIGLVPAGSMFACLQGIGASGFFAFNPYVYLICSVVNMILTGLIMYYQGCNLTSVCPCYK